METTAGKKQQMLHSIGNMVHTNTRSKPSIRRTVLIQQAKNRVDVITDKNIREVKPTKTFRSPTNGDNASNVDKTGESSSLPRYISHDSPTTDIQETNTLTTVSPWKPTTQTHPSSTVNKMPEKLKRDQMIPETPVQGKSRCGYITPAAKTQTKSDPCTEKSRNTRNKHNRPLLDMETTENSFIEQGVNELTKLSVNSLSKTKIDSDMPKGNENLSAISPQSLQQASSTNEMTSPSTSPDSRNSSLSRKSVHSTGSVTSQTSLAERIAETRSVLQLDGVQNFDCTRSRSASVCTRPDSCRSSMVQSRAGSSKSDSFKDMKTLKKHLPDMTPREGENSSPVIKRRSRRKILQAWIQCFITYTVKLAYYEIRYKMNVWYVN